MSRCLYGVSDDIQFGLQMLIESWGPPVRICSYSEIVNIRLEFIENGE